MYKTKAFHDWVPDWLVTVASIFLVMAQNMVSGVSSYSIGEVTSSLGQEAELIKVAFYSSSIGMATMLPLYYRLRQLLPRKKMLLFFLTLEFVLCVIGPSFKEGEEFIVISFMLGAIKGVCLIDAIGLIMVKLNPQNSRGLFYGIYYPISFTAGQIIGSYSAYLVINYDWAFVYYMAAPGILISIALVLLFMHPERSQRRVPLYRFDWIGMMLFAFFSFSLTVVCIYGERLNWFDSKAIQAGFLITICSFVLFVIRQLSVKRPFLNLNIFRYFPQVSIGIILMLIMYLGYNSGSITSAYMESILKYDHTYVAETSFYMIISFITIIPLVGWMLSKHYPVRIFLFTGFLLFALFHFISSRLFYAEQDITYLILAQILKGAAYGICITALSYYASQHVTREFNGHRAFLSISIRYVIATPLTSAIFGHWLLVSQRMHYTSLSANFTNENTAVVHNTQVLAAPSGGTSAVTMASIGSRVNAQSFLLGSIDIYTVVAIICLFLAISVLFIKDLDVHYRKHYKSYPLVDL